MILWMALYYLPFYYLAIKGFSPILTGVALFPQTFTVAPASIAAGITMAITGRYRWATWSGWVLTTFGMGLLIYIQTGTSTVAWIFLNVVGGVGTGLLFAAMAIAVQASSKSNTMADAVILFAFFRSFGQTVGVAVGGVVFQNTLKKKLLSYPTLAPHAEEYSLDSSSLVEIIKGMAPSLEKSQLQESYMSGLRSVFIVMTAIAAAALVASLWTEGLPLDRALETEQGFQHKAKNGDEETKTAK